MLTSQQTEAVVDGLLRRNHRLARLKARSSSPSFKAVGQDLDRLSSESTAIREREAL